MAKARRRRSPSSRKTYKRMRDHANRTRELEPAPVVTYTADQLPPDSALRRETRNGALPPERNPG